MFTYLCACLFSIRQGPERQLPELSLRKHAADRPRVSSPLGKLRLASISCENSHCVWGCGGVGAGGGEGDPGSCDGPPLRQCVPPTLQDLSQELNWVLQLELKPEPT